MVDSGPSPAPSPGTQAVALEGASAAGADPLGGRRWRVGGLALGAAAVGGLTAWSNRAGVALSPDAWALWEGSVSLLEAGRFTFLDGEPIRYWPPFAALVLAAGQAVLGVSGAALAWLLALQLAVAWVGWALLAARTLDGAAATPGVRAALEAAAATFAAALLLGANRNLLSHTTLLALLPWWLLALVAARAGGRAAAAAVAALGAALLTTHNTALVFWPGAALLLARGRPPREAARALTPLAPPLAAWLLVRLALGQGGSHVLVLGGRFGVEGNVTHLATGLGLLVAPALPRLAALAIGLGLLALALALVRGPRGGLARDLALLALLALGGLLALFSVIWVFDPLADRFVYFFPLVLAPAAASALAGRAPRAALALLLALTAPGLAARARDAAGGVVASRVPPDAWISGRAAPPPRAGRRIAPPARPPRNTPEDDVRRARLLFGR